jgi:hypothetical protein
MGNGQLSIDPIAKVAEHELVDTTDACAENDSEYVSFADRYMKPGKSYQVLFGGVPVAESFSGGMKVQVIAYCSGILRDYSATWIHTSSRDLRPPIDRKAAHSSSPYRRRKKSGDAVGANTICPCGRTNSLLEKIKVENLTRTIVAPATSPSITGSFSLAAADFETSGIVHNLFFIASGKSGELEPELVWTNLAQREAGVESQQLVDQADLLGDGEEEIVTEIFTTRIGDILFTGARKTDCTGTKSSRRVSAPASDSAELPAIKRFAPKSTAQRLGVHNSLR